MRVVAWLGDPADDLDGSLVLSGIQRGRHLGMECCCQGPGLRAVDGDLDEPQRVRGPIKGDPSTDLRSMRAACKGRFCAAGGQRFEEDSRCRRWSTKASDDGRRIQEAGSANGAEEWASGWLLEGALSRSRQWTGRTGRGAPRVAADAHRVPKGSSWGTVPHSRPVAWRDSLLGHHARPPLARAGARQRRSSLTGCGCRRGCRCSTRWCAASRARRSPRALRCSCRCA